jgi:UDP-N-acetylglucosamine 2-epimerase (non-hydrolysing)
VRTTILSVVGARPNFLKAAPLHREFLEHPDRIASVLVHTGQHYDFALSAAFFRDLELSEPDHHLEVGSGSHAVQTAAVMVRFEEVVRARRPDWVVVFGDVNSTLACALVCAKERIPLAHVEAGLRSFDRSMPEEINRVLTDRVSDRLFVTEAAGVDNLRREGVPDVRIHLVGNILIDTLLRFRERALGSDIVGRLGQTPRSYLVWTMHRAGTVDSEERLRSSVDLLRRAAERAPIVFPVHPRTQRSLERCGLWTALRSTPALTLTEPLGYLDFLCLVACSMGVVSDSGGVQAETTFLDVPCLTLRTETEQPVTVDRGTNRLVGLDAELVLRSVDEIREGRAKRACPIPGWDGRTAARITRVMLA